MGRTYKDLEDNSKNSYKKSRKNKGRKVCKDATLRTYNRGTTPSSDYEDYYEYEDEDLEFEKFRSKK